MVHARFLAPLVKARGFGMTTFTIKGKLIHAVSFLSQVLQEFSWLIVETWEDLIQRFVSKMLVDCFA